MIQGFQNNHSQNEILFYLRRPIFCYQAAMYKRNHNFFEDKLLYISHTKIFTENIFVNSGSLHI